MADKKYDPTEGMTSYQKLMAGIGMGMVSAAEFVGNKVGLVSDDSIAERKKLDQHLLNTTEGKIGNALGVAAAGIGVAAGAAIAVETGAAAAVGQATLRAGQAAVRMPVNTVKKFVDTTKTVASAVKNAPQTVASAAKTARQTAAIAREMPKEAALTVARAAGNATLKGAQKAVKIGGGLSGAIAANSAREAISETDTPDGINLKSLATGAAIVGVAVVGKRLKMAQSVAQTISSWKTIGLAGSAFTSAAAGATALGLTAGIDEAISSPVAARVVSDIKEQNIPGSVVGGAAIVIREQAEQNPVASLLHEALSLSKTYTTTLAHMDYAREQNQKAELAKESRTAPPAVTTTPPDATPTRLEAPPLPVTPAPARPSVAFQQQAQKPAHLGHAHQKAARHLAVDSPSPSEPVTHPDSPHFSAEAQAISQEVGGVKNVDTLARALEAIEKQPQGAEIQLARAPLATKSPSGPS